MKCLSHSSKFACLPVGALWWLTILTNSNQQELCGSLNGRTIYLQLGEHGKILHRNQSSLEYHPAHCGVELVTCPSCSIQITVNHLQLPQICSEKSTANDSTGNNCNCGSLAIWEPSGHTGPTHLCKLSTENIFTSFTRSVGISFESVGRNWTGSFSLSFIAQRNQIIVNGMIGQNGDISSPNFPSLYPRDFGIEHVLSCMSENCTIELLFTDFLISPSSIMEFYDWDGRPLQLVSGIIARPPPIYSTGSSLTVRFFGNGGTSLGYKANYQFRMNSTIDLSRHTECGGEVDNLGGTIFMTGLTGYYDCIWTVQPAQLISHFKTHIYLKVLEYADEGELAIHLGQTSEDRLIETFIGDHKTPIEHVAPISKGFYISFKGTLVPSSKLIIAYASFAYMDCLTGIDLLCGNKRCISIQLMCDSVDNCGDNSDEIGECESEAGPAEVSGQYWWPIKGGTTGGGSVLGGALIAGGAALAGVALMLAAALCRLALRSRPPSPPLTPHHTDHARTIAHLLNIADLDDRDSPPLYEPPPEYSQIVKPVRPRRKHSAQRLIERDSPSQQICDDDTIIPSSSMSTETKIKPAIDQDLLSNTVLKRISDSSPPASLETTGYDEQDLGLSLTLSTSSQKDTSKFQDLQWLTTTSNRLTSTPSNLSAVSFDTLNSSQERMVNVFPRLTKSHSQDNLLMFRSSVPTTMQDNFCFNFQVQLPKEIENLREPEPNNENRFSFNQPVLTHLRNISDGVNHYLIADPQIASTSVVDNIPSLSPILTEQAS